MNKKSEMVDATKALPGRSSSMPVPEHHDVLGSPLTGPFEPNLARAEFALGCFWGAERLFWTIAGVTTTAVGYAGGFTENPTYEEVCSGRTGHTETVLVIFNPEICPYENLLKVFWESHNPTQGMRQGNDTGTQYRSAIFTTTPEQAQQAQQSAQAFQAMLTAASLGTITTEIAPAGKFYYAEPYHQQYLDKNPGGYCGLAGTGVTCAIGNFIPE
jgi:peptide-methionine (S)-S-oxide reductase